MGKHTGRITTFSNERVKAKPSLHEVLDTFMAQADTLITGVVEGLAGGVRGSVGLAVGMDATNLRPLVELIIQARGRVADDFSASLHKGMFEGPGMDATQHQAVTYEDLKFLEEDELDANIELARIVEDVERAVSEVLPQTHALMSTLLGWVSVQPQLNPVRPFVFATALRDAVSGALDEHEWTAQPSTAREQLLTAAAGYLGVGLAGLYKQNADWLKSAGVEPAGINLSETSPNAQVIAQPESSLAKTLLTLDRLRKLLTGQIEIEQPHLASLLGSFGGKDFLHTIPASMLALQDMEQVDQLLNRLSERAKSGPVSTQEAMRQKALAVELRLGKQLGKHLGTEVIRLMVENLTQDQRLLLPVRQLLHQLEPQLVALGNKDQRFFGEREHPARQLVDSIANRSLGFSSTQDQGFAEFYQSIKLVVGSLSQPNDDIIAAFSTAQALLKATWQQQDEADRARQQEVAKALLRIEQRNLLAQHIAHEYKLKLSELSVPISVQHFLCGPWAQVLAERKMQNAAPSDRFDHLADNLIWSVQTKRASRNPARLVQLVPEMVRTLREGLHDIEYPDEMVKEFFDELIAVHEAALERASRRSAAAAVKTDLRSDSDEGQLPVPQRLPDTSQPVSPRDFWVAQKESEESGFLDTRSSEEAVDEQQHIADLDPLPIGTWVDMELEGNSVRANMRWASPYQNLFMFVTQDGTQHSMTRKSVDRMRANGQLRVVAQGGMLKAALDRVADTALKNSLKVDVYPETETSVDVAIGADPARTPANKS